MRSRREALLAGVGLMLPAAGVAATPVTVFAAASLQESLSAVAAAWTGPGRAVRTSFGASSAMARQLAQGAPADLFLSADLEWMDWAARRKLIVPGSRRNLLSNSLVLIAPANSRISLRTGRGMPLARALGAGRLAIADVTAVPAGKYAKASLTALGVWPSVESRLLPAENVRAALAYVSRGEAPLGVVYATDARADPRVRVVGTLPASSHAPIVYPGALTAVSRHPRAGEFLRYLRSPPAAAIFRRHGFVAPVRRA